MTAMASPAPKFEKRWADEAGTSAYTGLARGTLKAKRLDGSGPPYSKIGKRVLYDLDEVDRWLRRFRRTSTRERAEFLA